LALRIENLAQKSLINFVALFPTSDYLSFCFFFYVLVLLLFIEITLSNKKRNNYYDYKILNVKNA